MFQKWDDATDARLYMLCVVDGIPKLHLSLDGTDASIIGLSSYTTISANEWTHIAVVRSGSELAFYINNVLVMAVADMISGSVFDGAADVLIGYGLDGVIDELRYSSANKETALNQVSTSYVYNERNQLVTETTADSVKTYTYDNNGNNIGITEVVDGVTVATETLAYDELNRMINYSGPRGTESFTYRGAKWHRYTANGKTFLLDGENVLADVSSRAITAFYVTPYLDMNLSITQNGSTHYYSTDALGSVRALTDNTGAVANRYDYLPFGEIYQPNTSGDVSQRYTFDGRESNAVTPIRYYRTRPYDPRNGLMRNRNPWGYIHRNFSLYDAMNQNTVMWREPFSPPIIERPNEGGFGTGNDTGGIFHTDDNRSFWFLRNISVPCGRDINATLIILTTGYTSELLDSRIDTRSISFGVTSNYGNTSVSVNAGPTERGNLNLAETQNTSHRQYGWGNPNTTSYSSGPNTQGFNFNVSARTNLANGFFAAGSLNLSDQEISRLTGALGYEHESNGWYKLVSVYLQYIEAPDELSPFYEEDCSASCKVLIMRKYQRGSSTLRVGGGIDVNPTGTGASDEIFVFGGATIGF